jgi:hypothetical protein
LGRRGDTLEELFNNIHPGMVQSAEAVDKQSRRAGFHPADVRRENPAQAGNLQESPGLFGWETHRIPTSGIAFAECARVGEQPALK